MPGRAPADRSLDPLAGTAFIPSFNSVLNPASFPSFKHEFLLRFYYKACGNSPVMVRWSPARLSRPRFVSRPFAAPHVCFWVVSAVWIGESRHTSLRHVRSCLLGVSLSSRAAGDGNKIKNLSTTQGFFFNPSFLSFALKHVSLLSEPELHLCHSNMYMEKKRGLKSREWHRSVNRAFCYSLLLLFKRTGWYLCHNISRKVSKKQIGSRSLSVTRVVVESSPKHSQQFWFVYVSGE